MTDGKENLKNWKGVLFGSLSGLAMLMLLLTVTAILLPKAAILQTRTTAAGKICLLLSSVVCGTVSSRIGTGKKLLRSIFGVICLWLLLALKAALSAESGSWAKLGFDLIWMLVGGAIGAILAVTVRVTKFK